MTQVQRHTPKIIATAENFTLIEKAIQDYFHQPKKVIINQPGQWDICLPDGTPFGAVHSYHIIQTGARYKFVCLLRDPNPPIITRNAK